MQAEIHSDPACAARPGICFLLSLLILWPCLSCRPDARTETSMTGEKEQEVLIKRREDGSISSVNQIDSMGYVHGLRVTYYADGKTVYSKTQLNHGIKDGAYIRYYDNGQVFDKGVGRFVFWW